MAFPEKSNWVVLVIAVPTLLIYAAVIVPQVLSRPMPEVEWVPPIVVSIVGFIVANVVGNIVAAVSNPADADKHDVRDAEIDRYGEWVGNWAIAIGATAALILAITMADHFWIANAIFLGFMAGAIVSAIAKIAAYHGTFQRW
jgi:hypothetical protein